MGPVSGGTLLLGAQSSLKLDTILNRMEERGDLSSTQEFSEEGRTRRVYRVTDEGRRRLKAGLEYMLRRKRLLDELERYYEKHFPDGDA